MPFRLWYYTTFVAPGLFILIFLQFVFHHNVYAEYGGIAAKLLLIPLGITGVVLGILWSCGKLRMKCPFCSAYGSVYASKEDGLSMVCPKCGWVHGSGPLKWKLICEEIEPGEDESNNAL